MEVTKKEGKPPKKEKVKSRNVKESAWNGITQFVFAKDPLAVGFLHLLIIFLSFSLSLSHTQRNTALHGMQIRLLSQLSLKLIVFFSL
jgi:hypothetical protein